MSHSNESTPEPPSSEEILKLLGTLQTAVDATESSAAPLLKKAKKADPSLDFEKGISLLLVRPQLLLASLQHLVQLVGLRLTCAKSDTPNAGASAALSTPFNAGTIRERTGEVEAELAGELALCHDVMDKVRSMEGKLEYQVKKAAEVAEDDMLSFRPNAAAMLASARSEAAEAAKPRKSRKESDDESEADGGVYKPPRVAAMPYNEEGEKRVRERRAPALLSEFAQSLAGAPAVQTTSGLSTRPVQAGAHTNSASARRAAELQRIAEFEEENMTRLVTSKREAKRRREDEEALALGFGVGGARNRRRNGLEAELEGVLGDGGSSAWDGAGDKFGKREGITKRAKTAGGRERNGKAKKSRFEKDVKKKRKAIGLPTK
ncbi:hypothetical protein A1Q2_03851 [Trichosporon asahii var. asahii CBS 8904]|uniref:Uncharacterized protein n=1 Tax=Trichosporon asahii var. asahii (strain CBS 8904) TaxID=1220162 RepID=K1VYH4_TRIAC|nr:hypothetical protein A1Q2_03851 [Trichosporon asahii var. asahii CBS 8904]